LYRFGIFGTKSNNCLNLAFARHYREGLFRTQARPTMILRLATAAAAAALTCAVSLEAAASDLTITIDNLRSDKGQVLLCVFSADTSDTKVFPDCDKGKPVRSQKVTIGGGKVVVTYYGLKDGVYAVAMIHDENGNGTLDTNFIGIPTEGLGVSNNPRLTGKPGYDEAKFNIKGNTAITITAKYFL
jgi:uncharacterized protein (DUF2141 family)